MESQKIINLLDSNNSEAQKSATKRWYIPYNPYGNGTDGTTTIKYETKVIKPSLCDYSDAYILVAGNIQNKPAGSIVAFKNCAPFRTCDVTINDEHVEKNRRFKHCNAYVQFLQYSENYQNSTGILYQFKRDEPSDNNADVENDTTSLVHISKLISGTDNNNFNDVKLAVPLKCVSNFFRSLEMPLVICKIDLELTWDKDCMICSNDAAAGQVVSFMITNTRLYVPIVTLSTKDNTNLTKQLNEGSKRTVYWNQYMSEPFLETLHKKLALVDFLLMQLFNELIDYLFLLLKIPVQTIQL